MRLTCGLARCLQEVSYLTSPQAINPLPNRPLLSNSSLPLALPNVPSFEQMALNSRPRKVMPDVGKDAGAFGANGVGSGLLSGVNLMSGPPSAPASSGPQIPLLERGTLGGVLSGGPGSGMLQNQAPGSLLQQQQQQQQASNGASTLGASMHQPPPQQERREDGSDGEPVEPRQLTAIFRPDDAGEWKEKLRQAHEAHEASERERVAGATGWEQETGLEDEDKEEADTTEEDEGVVGEGDGAKVWKAKRTLRK
jgi:striatin 1/3/4